MTTYNVNIFGRTLRYDLAPLDIINNVCESLAGEYEVMLMDGMIEQAPSKDKFCAECYRALVAKRLDLYLDGTEITIDTPTEVRFYSEAGIKEIASRWYDEVVA